MTRNGGNSTESSARKRKNDENSNNEKAKSSNTSVQSDQIIEPSQWTFGSFTFLNFVSAFTLVIGIVTAMIFARVYFDQRLDSTIPTTEDIKSVAEPQTIQPDAQEKTSWKPPSGFDKDNRKDATKTDETPTTDAAYSDHPDMAVDINEEPDNLKDVPIPDHRNDSKDVPIPDNKNDSKYIPIGSDEHSEIIGQSTTAQQPTTSPIEETQSPPASEKLSDSKDAKEEQHFVTTEESSTQASIEASEYQLPETLKVSDISETLQPESSKVNVQSDLKDIEVVDEDEITLDEINTDQHISGVDQKVFIDDAERDGQKRELNVSQVINIAKNIADVEEMYQWVLEDAETVGIEKVLSELDKHDESTTGGFVKLTLAKACLLDRLSTINEIDSNVKQALSTLNGLIGHVNCTKEEKIFAHRKIAEKQLRQGNYAEAIEHTKNVIELDPEDTYLQVELSMYYMYAGEIDKARENLEAVIEKDPENGLAMLNLGSLQMVSVGQSRSITTSFDKVAEMLIYGLNNTDPSLHEPRHYSQLYDALIRSGRESEVSQYMRKGVEEDVILSEYQLCQSFINGHPSKPFWSPAEMTYNFTEVSELIENFTQSHADKMELFETHPENPFLVQSGDIEIFELLMDGYRTPNCDTTPQASTLCDIAEKVIGTCTFCDSHIIKMSQNAAYWKHSGITNLGLRTAWIMYNSSFGGSLTVDVGGESKVLEKEKFVIFDNSYIHRLHSQSPEVGESALWIFVADSWHPNVGNDTKESLQRV